jgi:hypothetical protein
MLKTKMIGILLLASLTVLSVSCQNDVSDTPVIPNPPDAPLITKTFWAQNMEDVTFYQLTAELMATGDKCTVWAEQTENGGISPEIAQNMANKYDKTIRPLMISSFGVGEIVDEAENLIARDTMELADWLADGDGKFAILFLDIKDGWTPGNSYVAGYCWKGNLFENDPDDQWLRYSNQMDMIYVDSGPGVPCDDDSNAVLAHEMQHLMNFVNGFVTGRAGEEMDLWIDEGLSSAAEYLYRKEAGVTPVHPIDRYGWFVDDPEGTIAKGNNFFVWGNDTGSRNSIMDEYATVYMLFQWLRLKSGGSIYKNISLSDYTDYRALTNAVYPATPGLGSGAWSGLLKTWMAANYVNNSSGEYGYKGEFDSSTPAFAIKTFPTNEATHSLLPGEGVYSISTSLKLLPSSSGNIRYAGLKKDILSPVDNGFVFRDGVLLTYNISTNMEDVAESGKLTGVTASVGHSSPASASMSLSGSASGEADFSGPLRIDARDMHARTGYGGGGAFLPGQTWNS